MGGRAVHLVAVAVAVAQRKMANAEPIGSGENGVSRLRWVAQK